MQSTELLLLDAFYTKFRRWNPLEWEYNDYGNFWKNGLTTEQAVIRLKQSKPPPTGNGNYQDLEQIWQQEQMNSLQDFFAEIRRKCGDNFEGNAKKDCPSSRLKYRYAKAWLYFNLPNLAIVCLHISTDATFYILRI